MDGVVPRCAYRFGSLRKLIPVDVPNEAVRKNQLAMLDITEVFTYYYLVTTFGNIPYSKAMNIDSVYRNMMMPKQYTIIY